MSDNQPEEVLTLAEAAAYLRVAEEDLLRLADQREIPGQRIGSEWRFLKRALCSWLTYGPRFHRDFRVFEHPILEEFLHALKHGMHQSASHEPPKRGSKQATQRHVGALKDADDLEQVLAGLAAMRQERVEEGTE